MQNLDSFFEEDDDEDYIDDKVNCHLKWDFAYHAETNQMIAPNRGKKNHKYYILGPANEHWETGFRHGFQRRPHFYIKPKIAKKLSNKIHEWIRSMSEWHRLWQAAVFPKHREIQVKNNRADIKIENKVFEIQHSELSEKHIKKRLETYGKDNLFWIVDVGNIDKIKWNVDDKQEIIAIFKDWNNCFKTVHKIIDLEAGTLYLDPKGTELFKFIRRNQESNEIVCHCIHVQTFLQIHIGEDALDPQGAWLFCNNKIDHFYKEKMKFFVI